MDISEYLLSMLIWLPTFGGVALLVVGDDGDFRSSTAGIMRWGALLVSLLVLLLSAGLYVEFDATTSSMQFVEHEFPEHIEQ